MTVSRTTVALVLLVAVLVSAAGLAACGDGDEAAPVGATLPPSASPTTLMPSSAGSPATASSSPAPGASTPAPAGSPAASSPGALPTPAPSPSRVTDAWIKADLLRRLSAAPELVGHRLRVAVVKRIVFIWGHVETERQKQIAEAIAVSEPFIKEVRSTIVVTPDNGY